MPVTPTGPLSLPLEHLRQLVAACTSFQTWTGTASQAAAATRVHLIDLPEPDAGEGGAFSPEELETLRPLAVINEFIPPGEPTYANNFRAMRIAEGELQVGGRLLLRFEADVPPEHQGDSAGKAADAKMDFLNHVGAVVQEMYSLQATQRLDDTTLMHLSVHGINQFLPATRSGEGERRPGGDYLMVDFYVDWGV